MERTRIIVFGIGAISKLLTEKKKDTTEIVAYIADEIDADSINGIPIISLEQLIDWEYDYVVVAFGNTIKGIQLLKGAGVPDTRIVGYAYSGIDYSHNIFQKELNDLIHTRIRNDRIPDLFELTEKQYYLCGMNVPHDDIVITQDFVREQTLAFLSEEIYRKNIKGAVAEVGVSAGEFAWKINTLFSDRVLYLYDTFDGVPLKDMKKAICMGWGEKHYVIHEKGTIVEKVMEKMPFPEMCRLKKGVFPATFEAKEQYAFVSLDIDFYGSIKEGLEIIYQNMALGGYIMVHDFHNLSFVESRQAVIDFCDVNNVPYVPIPDNGGSAILVKVY